MLEGSWEEVEEGINRGPESSGTPGFPDGLRSGENTRRPQGLGLVFVCSWLCFYYFGDT